MNSRRIGNSEIPNPSAKGTRNYERDLTCSQSLRSCGQRHSMKSMEGCLVLDCRTLYYSLSIQASKIRVYCGIHWISSRNPVDSNKSMNGTYNLPEQSSSVRRRSVQEFSKCSRFLLGIFKNHFFDSYQIPVGRLDGSSRTLAELLNL